MAAGATRTMKKTQSKARALPWTRWGRRPQTPFIKALYLVTAITLVTAPALAETSYVHAGRLVDVEHSTVLTNQLIRVVDGRIVSVTQWISPPTDGPVTDWSHYMVLPGLIDMHTHIADWEQTANDAEPLLHSAQDVALVGALHARRTLRAGFTTVHDVGCYRAFTDVALRNAINRGWVEGPRMNVVGAYITIKGGGGDMDGV